LALPRRVRGDGRQICNKAVPTNLIESAGSAMVRLQVKRRHPLVGCGCRDFLHRIWLAGPCLARRRALRRTCTARKWDDHAKVRAKARPDVGSAAL